MFSCDYLVTGIDGDYAHLSPLDASLEEAEDKLVARALLPPDIYEGCKLRYEWLQYSILPE